MPAEDLLKAGENRALSSGEAPLYRQRQARRQAQQARLQKQTHPQRYRIPRTHHLDGWRYLLYYDR